MSFVERRPDPRFRPLGDEPLYADVAAPDLDTRLPVHDLAIGGVGLAVPAEFDGCPAGTRVELEIVLPRRGTLRARGIVRHVSGKRGSAEHMGVAFERLADEERERLTAFLSELQERWLLG